MFAIDGSSYLKVIDEQNTLCIPKYRSQNLACWCLHHWSLWMAFTCCCPLNLLPIWFQSEVVDPYFPPWSHIYALTPFCSIETVANNALNCRCVVVFDWLWANTVPTLNTAFSLFSCSWKMIKTLPSYILCYLTQLQFMIGQNEFAEFFGVFQDNCRI